MVDSRGSVFLVAIARCYGCTGDDVMARSWSKRRNGMEYEGREWRVGDGEVRRGPSRGEGRKEGIKPRCGGDRPSLSNTEY